MTGSATLPTFVLPDVLTHGLKVVFCGTAPGDQSALRKAYYAGPGNLFYPTLAACDFTSRRLAPHEYPSLLDFGLGLTDLVKHTYGMDSDLEESDYDRESFERKILQYQPRFVCFNSKQAGKVYLQLKTTGQLQYGLQKTVIGKTRLFVAPSTSLQAQKYWDQRHWRQLKELVG